MNSGEVILVGAGPGDPGLLTRAGAAWIARADVVVYDSLSDRRLLALARPGAELIFAGKSKGLCVLSQEEINRVLAAKAKLGLTVVRLKGGDPFVFGRGAEEAEHLLAEGVPFRIVPGVTAGVGVSAHAGIPLTHRGVSSSIAFVTGHHDPAASDPLTGKPRVDWTHLGAFPGTIVVYMGLTRLALIAETLTGAGKSPDTPAAVVASGTTPRQRTVSATLGTIAEAVEAVGLASPALLIVGDVVTLRPGLVWYERAPLFGRRIVVTRPAEEGAKAAAALEELGAEAILAPTIDIRPLEDFGELDAMIARLAEFDWVVFASPNGVAKFLDRILHIGKDLRMLGRARLAAMGPATAEALRTRGLRADLVPPSFRSESLAESLAEVAAGRKILLVRADRGRALLKDELSKVAEVVQTAAYRNVDAESFPPEVVARIERGDVDWITLTSSAIAARLHAVLSPDARAMVGADVRLATLSPVTTGAVEALGWRVSAEAKRHDWQGLVAALVAAESGFGVG